MKGRGGEWEAALRSAGKQLPPSLVSLCPTDLLSSAAAKFAQARGTMMTKQNGNKNFVLK